MNKISKADRVRFGVTGQPINGTRVFANPNDHDFGGKSLISLLVINDEAGTVTAANVYHKEADMSDMGTGANYDAEGMVQPLPAEGDAKWKAWKKKGYEEANIDDYPVVRKIGSKAPAKPAAKPAAPATK